MSANQMSTEVPTPITKLFEKFLNDVSKIGIVKKDTDCLIAQIVAHMATPECKEDALNNLERIFQRSFRTEDEESSIEATPEVTSGFNSPIPTKTKKTPEIKEKKSKKTATPVEELETPTEVKEKKKPGPKAKKTEEEPQETPTEVKEKKKPGPKAKKTEDEQETPTEVKEKKKPGPKAKKTEEDPQETPAEVKEKKKPASKTKSKKESVVEEEKETDMIARLVSVTEEDKELTEDDLLEICSESDDESE